MSRLQWKLVPMVLGLALAGCPDSVEEPIASAGDNVEVAAGSVVRLDGSKSSDAQDRPLSYAWSFASLPGDSKASLREPRSQTPSFVADVPGDYEVQLIVSNGILPSKPAKVRITANNCGAQAPVLRSLAAAPAAPAAGSLVQLSADVDDPDNACGAAQVLSYQWWIVSLPAGSKASLNNAQAVAPSFQADVPGEYKMRVLVTDSTGRSATGDLTVTARTCGATAPVIVSIGRSNDSPSVGSIVQLDAIVSDGDTDQGCGEPQAHSYRWAVRSLPAGSRAALNSETAVNPSFTPDLPGSYVVRLVVTDSTGRSSAPFDVIVLATGCGAAVPVVQTVNVNPSSVGLGAPVQLSAVAKDPDNEGLCNQRQTLTYSWFLRALPPGSNATLNNAGGLNPSFTPDVAGDYLFEVVVTDSTGRRSDPFLTTVTASTCGNAVPSVDLIGATPPAPNVGQEVTLNSTVTDGDNLPPCSLVQGFSYSWTLPLRPGGSNSTLDDPGVAGPKFRADAPGTYQVGLVVTDPTGKTSPQRFLQIITATCGLASPSVTASVSVASPNVGQTVILTAIGTDSDNSSDCAANQTLAYTWQIVSRPLGSSAILSDPTLAAPAFVPDLVGSYQFQVLAIDTTGRSSPPAYVNVTTAFCGTATPGVSASVDVPNPNPGQQVMLSALATDADNASDCGLSQTFSYSWIVTARPPGSGTVLSDPASPSPTFVPDAAGSYQFQVSATDNTNRRSNPAYVTLVTTLCGTAAPTVTATATPATPNVGQGTVTLAAIAADADNGSDCNANQNFGYAWTIVSRPAGSTAVISDPSAVSPTFSPDKVGSYQFQVVARDSTARTSQPAFASVTTSTCGTAAPSAVLAASPANPNMGQPVTLSAAITDDDNSASCNSAQTFTHAWAIVSRPAGSSALLSDPRSPTPTFTPDVVGSYQLSATVTDSAGVASLPAYVNVTTTLCGAAVPSVSATASPAAPNIGQVVTITAAGADADNATDCNAGETFSYAWTIVSRPAGSAAALSDPASPAPTLEPDAVGTFQLRVVATDSAGHASLPAFVNVTTTSCGSARPSVTAIAAPAAPNIGNAVTLAATLDDADTTGSCALAQTQTHLWSLVVRPAGSQASLDDPSSTTPRFTPDVVGTYRVSLTVTDSTGLASPPFFASIVTTACGAAAPVAKALATANQPPLDVGEIIDLDALVTDADTGAACGRSETFSYTWAVVSRPVGSVTAIPDPQVAPATFRPDVVGTYQFSVVVRDSTGLAAPVSYVTATTTACSSAAPSVAPSASFTGAALDVGEPVTLDAGQDDPDNSPACGLSQTFTHAWSVVSRPAGSAAALSNPSAASPTFVPDEPGSYQFSVQVTDSTGRASPTDYVTVSTSNCGGNAPRINPSFSTLAPPLDVGEVVTLFSGVGDDDISACGLFQSLTQQWTVLARPPGSAATLSDPGTTSPTFVPDVAGTYQFSVSAEDSTGRRSPTGYVTLSTTACGTAAPVITAISGPQNPVIGTTSALSATISDADTGSACLFAESFRHAWTLSARPSASQAVLTGSTTASASFTPDVLGTYQVSLIVTDSTGRDSAPFVTTIVTASCGGAAPTTTASASVPAPPADIGETVTLAAAATDADNGGACNLGQSFGYVWSVVVRPTGSSAPLSDPAAASPTFVPDVAGAYQFSVVVTDSLGLSSSTDYVTVTTSACGANAPTTAADFATGAPPVDIGEVVTLSAGAADNDNSAACALGQTLTHEWAVVARPPGSAAALSDPAAASPSFVPDVVGTYQFRVVVTDSTNLVSPADFVTVTTSGCGAAAPVVNAVTVPASPVIGTSSVLAAAVSDADTSGACGLSQSHTLAWTITARPVGSQAVLVGPLTSAPRFTPDVVGIYQISVVATDSTGRASAPFVSTINTSACGTAAPTVAATSSVAVPPLDIGETLMLDAGQADADNAGACALGQTFTFAWEVVTRPAGSAAALSDPAAAAPAFVPDQPGTYQFSVAVTDSTGRSSATDYLTVTTTTCGGNTPTTAPTFAVGAAPVDIGEAVTLAANAADLDNAACGLGQTLLVDWAIVGRPAGSVAALSDPGVAGPTFVGDVVGTYQFRVTATDSSGRVSAPGYVSFTTSSCGANDPVVIAIAVPASPNIGTTYTLTATVDDADTGSACGFVQAHFHDWSLIARPAGSSAVVVANSPTASFRPDLVGTYQVQLIVRDAAGRASQPFITTITTSACGSAAPTAAPTASVTVPPFDVMETVTLAAGQADADNFAACAFAQSFTFAWDIASAPAGSAATLSDPAAASPTLVPDLPGTYQLGVVVTDSTGRSSARTFVTFTTSNCGGNAPTSAPSFSVGTLPVDVAETVTLASAAADLDNSACGLGQVLLHDWSIVARPAGSAQPLSDPGAAAPTFVPDAVGTYEIRLVVTDSTGKSSVPAYVRFTTSTCSANAPTITSVTVPAGPNVGSANALSAVIADADNLAACGGAQTITHAWSLTARPSASQSVLANPTTAGPTFTPDVVGTYQVSLTVTDSTGRFSLPSVRNITTSTCGANRPTGAIAATTTTPNTNASVGLTASATDLDNTACPPAFAQTHTFAWFLLSGPSGSSAALSGTGGNVVSLVPDLPGDFVVEMVATDSAGVSAAPTRVTITAGACGANPASAATVGATPAFTATQIASGVTRTSTSLAAATLHTGFAVQMTANIVDNDTVPLASGGCGLTQGYSLTWSLLGLPPGSAATLNDPGALNPSFVPDVPGSYVLQLVTMDTTGRSSNQTFTVTTGGCGDFAPTALAGVLSPVLVPAGASVSATVVTGFAVQLDGSASSDLDAFAGGCNVSQTLGHRWAIVSLPAGSAAALNNSTAINPSLTPTVSGTYVVELLVSDGANTSAAARVTLNAQAGAFVVDRNIGQFTAVALDPLTGNPVVAYTAGNDPVRVARCTSGCYTGTPAWTNTADIVANIGNVTFPGGEQPRPIDIKLTSAGQIFVAFYTRTPSCSLHVAAYNSGSNTWNDRVIETGAACNGDGDNALEFGRWLSLAITAGDRPAVAYTRRDWSIPVSNTRFAVCTANCTLGAGATWSAPANVNPSVNGQTRGRWPSLKVTSAGLVRVAYYNDDDGALANYLGYAECSGACLTTPATATWTNVVVDNAANDLGRFASLDIGAAGPRIAYRDESDNLLKYATCTSGCTTSVNWSNSTVDSSANVGEHASLVLDANGNARIAYRDGSATSLKYAFLNASGLFSTMTLDNAAAVGEFCSLALSAAGSPRISYFDASAGNIKFFTMGD